MIGNRRMLVLNLKVLGSALMLAAGGCSDGQSGPPTNTSNSALQDETAANLSEAETPSRIEAANASSSVTRSQSSGCVDEAGNPLPTVSNPCMADAGSKRAAALSNDVDDDLNAKERAAYEAAPLALKTCWVEGRKGVLSDNAQAQCKESNTDEDVVPAWQIYDLRSVRNRLQ